MSNVGLYAKAVGAALAAAGTAAITALNDGNINTLEWVTIVGAFVAGLGAVWALPEFPVGIAKYLKAISAGLVAGLASLSALLVSGHAFTTQDWINIAIAVVVGSGLVHVTKNAAESQTMAPLDATSTSATDPDNLPVDDEDVIEDDVPEDEYGDIPVGDVEEDLPIDDEAEPLETK